MSRLAIEHPRVWSRAGLSRTPLRGRVPRIALSQAGTAAALPYVAESGHIHISTLECAADHVLTLAHLFPRQLLIRRTVRFAS